MQGFTHSTYAASLELSLSYFCYVLLLFLSSLNNLISYYKYELFTGHIYEQQFIKFPTELQSEEVNLRISTPVQF